MSRPQLSVVLPVHNSRRYLREALDSVLAQTFTDFELLVWDDASADDSPQIIDGVAGDPRVRRFANRVNLGLFATLNRAVAECRADRVRLWAHDDRMKPHCLEREQAYWRAHPDVGMSYCQCDLIDADGRVVQPAGADATPEVVEPWLVAQISYYFGCMPGNISTVTFRKDVFEALGGFADMRVSADFDMWERISQRHPVGFIRESLIELRQHANQFSRWKGEELHFLREDRPVLRRLFERLPAELRPHARSYHLRRRVTQYVHYMMRALAAGRVRFALQVLKEVRHEGNVAWLLFLWLVTRGGRWFRPRPIYQDPSPAPAEPTRACLT